MRLRSYNAAERDASSAGGWILRRTLALGLLCLALGGAAVRSAAQEPSASALRDGITPLACATGEGVAPTGIPIAALCRAAGVLDQPIDEGLAGRGVMTRSGQIHPALARPLLRVGRPRLGEEEFAALDELPPLTPPDSRLAGRRNGLARALLAERERNPARAVELDARLAALTSPDGVPYADTLEGNLGRLLPPRRDRDRVADLLEPGSGSRVAADAVAESALGVSEDFNALFDALLAISGRDRVRALPRFVGPDGVALTADDLPIVRCPPGSTPLAGPGGRCSGDAGEVEPLYYLAIDPTTGDVAPRGLGRAECRALLPLARAGGVNQVGECISLSTEARVNERGVLDGFSRTLAAARFLRDPALRPAEARLEPTVLTDFVLRSVAGSRLPARPGNPGGIVYPNAGRGPYARRVDPDTGAPAERHGPPLCRVRSAPDPVSGALRAAGPDGDPGTPSDNAIPSVGNCLLFDDPVGAEPQVARSSEAIAALHPANQTLFHALCALTFDDDTGSCDLDFPNSAALPGTLSHALAGDILGGVAATDDAWAIRVPPRGASRFDLRRYTTFGIFIVTGWILAPIGTELPRSFSSRLSVAQKALLGCGPALASGCDGAEFDRLLEAADRSFLNAAGIRAELGQVLHGGIDLLNARADVLLQEWTAIQVANAGVLVGLRSRRRPRFEAGVTGAGVMSAAEALALGDAATAVARDRIALDLFGLTVAELEQGLEEVRGRPVQEEAVRARIRRTATDLQHEPLRWVVDRDRLERTGVLVFLDPRGPNGVFEFGGGDDVVNPDGENCSRAYGPDLGCTLLEIISKNLERVLITRELLGADRVPDPPETAEEVMNILDGDPENDLEGDPVAGPDGIRFLDFDFDGDGRLADGRLDVDQKAIVLGQRELVVDAFSDCEAAATSTINRCYLNLGPDPVGGAVTTGSKRLVGALPVGLRMSVEFLATGELDEARMVHLQGLTPLELQEFIALEGFDPAQFVEVDAARLGLGDAGERVRLRPRPVRFGRRVLGHIDGSFLLERDVDGNGILELDEDVDGMADFADDGTRGPVASGNLLCGSGLPSDPLQDALQVELDAEQEALLAAALPGGLPPRSPVFCTSLGLLLGMTRELDPGQRAFLWHLGTPPDVGLPQALTGTRRAQPALRAGGR